MAEIKSADDLLLAAPENLKRYAVVNAEGLVYNVVMWDGVTAVDHEAAHVIQSDEANIGWTYADGELKPPPPPNFVTARPT